MTKAKNVMQDDLKRTPCCYGHDMLFDMTKLLKTNYV
jgi:hypothetical protein